MKNSTKPTIYILAIAAFAMIVFVMSYVSLRLDFSKNHAYTLSDSTRKVIRNLKDPVTITFYASTVLPSKLQPIKREVTDLLSEYKQAGGNKVILLTKDPKKDDTAKKEADQYAIPELNFSQTERDQFAVTTGYFGIGISENGKKAAIPQASDVADLEYNITSSIYKITIAELPKVGLIGGDSQEQQFTMLRQASSSQFTIVDTATPSASMKAALVIDNRQRHFTNEEVTNLEKYIRGGGRAIVMADGVWVSSALLTDRADHNLYGLFKTFGINEQEDLVLSTAAEIVNFGGGQNSFPVLTAYPYWIRTQSFDKTTSYFSNVRQLTFPWTSSVSVNRARGSAPVSLIKTVKTSWDQTSGYTPNPREIKPPSQKSFHEFTLGAESRLKNGGAILVIPDSRFVEDRFLSQTSDNLEFVLNVMSDYAAGGALSGIRQRSVDLYPLPPDLSNQQKDMFKYLTILLLPGLFAAYGVYRLVKRK